MVIGRDIFLYLSAQYSFTLLADKYKNMSLQGVPPHLETLQPLRLNKNLCVSVSLCSEKIPKEIFASQRLCVRIKIISATSRSNHNCQFSTFNSQSVENLNSQLFAIRFFSLNSFGSFSHFPLLGTFRGLPFSCLNM